MDRDDQNLDSFVDIVTNTAGILVLLVVLSMIESRDAGRAFNPKLARLANIQARVTQLRQNLDKIAADAKLSRNEAQEREEALRSEVVGLNEPPEVRVQLLSRSGRSGYLNEQKALHATKSASLMDLRKRKQRLQQDVATEEARSRPALSAMGSRDRTYVESVSANELEGDLSSLNRKAETQAVDETKIAEDLKRLKANILIATDDLTVAEAQSSRPRFEVDRPTTSNVHLLECYMPPASATGTGTGAGKTRPCVRFLRPTNPTGKAAGSAALPEGEDALHILSEESSYKAFLSEHDRTHKSKHRLHFLVRPDAYTAFRIARKLAWESGWRVTWTPAASAGK